MADREIVTCSEVGLVQNENGDFIVSKYGYHPYKLKENSRTWHIIRILDHRCSAQQRRYECANDIIHSLEQKLSRIESTLLYRFFHLLGAI
jgi:hypothetical protein